MTGPPRPRVTATTFTFTPQSTGASTVAVTGADHSAAGFGWHLRPGALRSAVAGGGGGGGGSAERLALGEQLLARRPGRRSRSRRAASGGSGSYTTYRLELRRRRLAASSSPYSSVNHTYGTVGSYTVICTVHDSPGPRRPGAGRSTFRLPQAPTNTIVPIAGFGRCTFRRLSVPVHRDDGDRDHVGIFQGSDAADRQLFLDRHRHGEPKPVVRAPEAHSPSLRSGPGRPPSRTRHSRSSVSIPISGTMQVPDFILSDATRPSIAPGTDGSFLVVVGRSTTFTGVVQGTTTPLSGAVSWNFGDGSSDTVNPASAYLFDVGSPRRHADIREPERAARRLPRGGGPDGRVFLLLV